MQEQYCDPANDVQVQSRGIKEYENPVPLPNPLSSSKCIQRQYPKVVPVKHSLSSEGFLTILAKRWRERKAENPKIKSNLLRQMFPIARFREPEIGNLYASSGRS